MFKVEVVYKNGNRITHKYEHNTINFETGEVTNESCLDRIKRHMNNSKIENYTIEPLLEIVKVSGKQFKMLDNKGYFIAKGYALRNKENKKYIGYISSNGTPYIPCGGKKALQEIIDAGGFISFDGMIYLNEMEVK